MSIENNNLERKNILGIFVIFLVIILIGVGVFFGVRYFSGLDENSYEEGSLEYFLGDTDLENIEVIDSYEFSLRHSDWCLPNERVINEEYSFFEKEIFVKRVTFYNQTYFCEVFDSLEETNYYIGLDFSEAFVVERVDGKLSLTSFELY